jgi:hypothetical protein
VSSGDFIVRFLLGMAASLVAAAFVAGCGAAHQRGDVLAAGQEQGAWASPAELAWLKRVGAWELRLMRSLERTALPVEDCAAGLSTQVGPAPTVRLRRALEILRGACSHGSADLLAANELLPPGEARQLPVIAADTGGSRVEPRFGRVASPLAGKGVEARCWSMPDWRHLMREERSFTGGRLGPDTLGFADINGNRVNLAPDVCQALVDLAYNHVQPENEAGRLMLGVAVVTLSHEAQHSKGVAREAEAECNAIQVAHRTAMKLGATESYAASLVRAYWSHYDEELKAYRSPDCRDGGALDLGYADSIWP